MVDYLLDRMDSLKRSRNSSVPVDFIPILDLRNPNKTIGFELYINFTGMHACGQQRASATAQSAEPAYRM
jgi:hypothetical protein